MIGKKQAIDVPGFKKVTGRARDLWEHLSGRQKHTLGLGARGCGPDVLGEGKWLLCVDGNHWFTAAVEIGGEIYESGHVPAPQVAHIPMTVFESAADVAKAEREKRLAEIDPLEAECQLREGWGLEVHRKPVYTTPKSGGRNAPKLAIV